MKLFDEIPYLGNERIELKRLVPSDAVKLKELTDNENVYRYLPTFLFEKQFEDPKEAIEKMYEGLFRNRESLILGIFLREGRGESEAVTDIHSEERGTFCGLAEYYGFKDELHKTCLGYRLSESFWGRGIASGTVKLMIDYLYFRTDTEIITASTMVENKASERVLTKNGFIMTSRAVEEDWGYEKPTITDKWFR
ncbi:MAG: GNAT family N-acetyltransferase [Lachnospiraceae bacterium]|nr:GNAT family N-acetyltransferase [Lachnospiraceae bacterium]